LGSGFVVTLRHLTSWCRQSCASPEAGNQGYVAEVPLVRHFKAMNCDVVESTATDFDVLVTMQHYLPPTRLLDWTENLLVALHFAVRDPDQDKEDGALWILNARRLNYWTSAGERAGQVLFQDELDVLARSSLSRVRRRAPGMR
jgi:hypothetical protein